MLTSNNVTNEQHKETLERAICNCIIRFYNSTGIKPAEIELSYKKLNQGKQGKHLEALKVKVVI